MSRYIYSLQTAVAAVLSSKEQQQQQQQQQPPPQQQYVAVAVALTGTGSLVQPANHAALRTSDGQSSVRFSHTNDTSSSGQTSRSSSSSSSSSRSRSRSRTSSNDSSSSSSTTGSLSVSLCRRAAEGASRRSSRTELSASSRPAVSRDQDLAELLRWAGEEIGVKAPKLKGGFVEGLRGAPYV